MKRTMKSVLAAILSLAMMSGLSATAYAEQVKKVNLKLSGTTPKAGQSINDNSFSVTTTGGIIRYSNWENPHGTWEKGDVPEIYVEIEAAAGWYEDSTKVTVTGMSATVEDCDIEDDRIRVTLRLPSIKSGTSGKYDLDPPDDLSWSSNTKASWDKVSDATKYEVKLYRNGNSVTTETTSNRSYNFKSSMTKEGDYSFRVRAIHSSSKGEWSEYSDEQYVSESEAKRNKNNSSDSNNTVHKNHNNNHNNNNNYNNNGGPNNNHTNPGAPTFSSYWRTDYQGNWHIYDRYGRMVTNCWLCDDAVYTNGQNIWYLIDAYGNMVSAGLVRDSAGNYYSLETEHNGYYGMMRYVSGTYGAVVLNLESQHNGRFGAILNPEAIRVLNAMYGTTDIGYISTRCVYTSQF